MPTLDFKGKQFVHSHHLSVPFRELRVNAGKSLPAEGEKPGLEDNLIIHGDNLEALKALLPTHAGKVDCIFIDPPYNTGNEGWCYNDNVRSPLMKEWIKKAANPVDKEDLERHDKWLCMMWPRLQLLHELLAEDGVIFVTIDDNEQHHLRGLLDEIFHTENGFYGHIAWQRKYATANDAKGFSAMFDHLLVYRKSAEFSRNLLERTEGNDSQYRHEDDRGIYRIGDYTCNKSAAERPNLYYGIKQPNTGEIIWPNKTGVWRYSEARHLENEEGGFVYWGAEGKAQTPGFKRYKHMLRGGGGTIPPTWWPHEFAGHTDEAKKEVREIFSDISTDFITPKPTRLLEKILEIATGENSLILDSFAGSGTTAHAVLKANAKDGGNRRFILVECESYADTLTAERVRRVIQGYAFTGTQREELMSGKLNMTTLKKARELLEKAESIENTEGTNFDRVKKTVKDGVFKVIGERDVEEKTPGLGGSFTYCELGESIDIAGLLSGKAMPDFATLARYVFYTATGQTLSDVADAPPDGFIGETSLYRVHLFYKADKDWLKGNEAALNEDRVKAVVKSQGKSGKRAIVFAVSKFMSQRELSKHSIEFCQLPYAIHRIFG